MGSCAERAALSPGLCAATVRGTQACAAAALRVHCARHPAAAVEAGGARE